MKAQKFTLSILVGFVLACVYANQIIEEDQKLTSSDFMQRDGLNISLKLDQETLRNVASYKVMRKEGLSQKPVLAQKTQRSVDSVIEDSQEQFGEPFEEKAKLQTALDEGDYFLYRVIWTDKGSFMAGQEDGIEVNGALVISHSDADEASEYETISRVDLSAAVAGLDDELSIEISDSAVLNDRIGKFESSEGEGSFSINRMGNGDVFITILNTEYANVVLYFTQDLSAREIENQRVRDHNDNVITTMNKSPKALDSNTKNLVGFQF